jgi:hypothetical protein
MRICGIALAREEKCVSPSPFFLSLMLQSQPAQRQSTSRGAIHKTHMIRMILVPEVAAEMPIGTPRLKAMTLE